MLSVCTILRAASRSIATLIRRSRTAWLSSRDVSKDEKYNFEVAPGVEDSMGGADQG